MSGPTNTGWTLANSWWTCLCTRKKNVKYFPSFFRTILARGHWQWRVRTLRHWHPWKSMGDMYGNMKCRPKQKIFNLLSGTQRNASHSDFSVMLLFFPAAHSGQESHSKIILKCISQQETWYLWQKSQDPASEGTSNRCVKCPWHTVPWFHIKPQFILILRFAKT